MITKQDECVDGIELRGRVYYMRKRVPAEYAAIEERAEVNKSLRTRDYKEAMARFAVAWHALNSEWAALNALKHDDESPDAFDSAIALLKNIGVP